MDTILFHPKLVHLPIALAVLMPLLAGGLVVAWWKKWLPRNAWWIAVMFQAVLVLAGIAALQTGEAEESRVERVVSERFIEVHESRAKGFVLGAGAVLAAMALSALLRSNRAAMGAAVLSTLGSVAILQLGYRTGQSGGELVYTHGAAQAYVTAKRSAAPAMSWTRSARDDDD